MDGWSTTSSLASESPSPPWSALALWLVGPVNNKRATALIPPAALRSRTALTGFAVRVALIQLA